MTRMAGSSSNKARLTDEQLTEILRLKREGKSISAIARVIGCHRQTVRMHLKARHEDIVADEARKTILMEELRRHFEALINFTKIDFKFRLDASPITSMQIIATFNLGWWSQPRQLGPISLAGMLGVPEPTSAMMTTGEWMRMYNPSPADTYLMQSLREHTKDSPMWVYWDRWRRKVADYESISRQFLEWVEEITEADLFEKIDPTQIDQIRWWLFGNILLMASGMEHEGVDAFRRDVLDQKGATIVRDADADRDGSLAKYKYACAILKQTHQQPEWTRLRSATAELKGKESQIELRRIARQIDDALVSIELMHGFPGHCHLCPV